MRNVDHYYYVKAIIGDINVTLLNCFIKDLRNFIVTAIKAFDDDQVNNHDSSQKTNMMKCHSYLFMDADIMNVVINVPRHSQSLENFIISTDKVIL